VDLLRIEHETCNAESLAAKLAEINAEKKRVFAQQ